VRGGSISPRGDSEVTSVTSHATRRRSPSCSAAVPARAEVPDRARPSPCYSCCPGPSTFAVRARGDARPRRCAPEAVRARGGARSRRCAPRAVAQRSAAAGGVCSTPAPFSARRAWSESLALRLIFGRSGEDAFGQLQLTVETHAGDCGAQHSPSFLGRRAFAERGQLFDENGHPALGEEPLELFA